MKLNQIRIGQAVFIDSNIFIYHTFDRSNMCSNLLRRCETGEIHGITSFNILIEVAHILMVSEALEKNLVTAPRAGLKLSRSPQIIKKLYKYYQQVELFYRLNIQIVGYNADLFLKSQPYRQFYGLSMQDSLIYGYMKSEGIRDIASNDSIFQKIPDISVYKPSDL